MFVRSIYVVDMFKVCLCLFDAFQLKRVQFNRRSLCGLKCFQIVERFWNTYCIETREFSIFLGTWVCFQNWSIFFSANIVCEKRRFISVLGSTLLLVWVPMSMVWFHLHFLTFLMVSHRGPWFDYSFWTWYTRIFFYLVLYYNTLTLPQ